MKDYEEIINEIDDIVKWWYNLKKGYTDLNNLDDVLRRLTGLYYYLSEIVSDSYKVYLMSYVSRKVGYSKRVQGFISNGSSATSAKEEAISDEDLRDEAEQESYYNMLKLKLNATSKIIESIRQKISNLKQEINKD
jgi:hypothetical protein